MLIEDGNWKYIFIFWGSQLCLEWEEYIQQAIGQSFLELSVGLLKKIGSAGVRLVRWLKYIQGLFWSNYYKEHT